MWTTYFQGKLVRLALHPVANFVVSKAVERLDGNQMKTILEELHASWTKAIRKHDIVRFRTQAKPCRKILLGQEFCVVL